MQSPCYCFIVFFVKKPPNKISIITIFLLVCRRTGFQHPATISASVFPSLVFINHDESQEITGWVRSESDLGSTPSFNKIIRLLFVILIDQ